MYTNGTTRQHTRALACRSVVAVLLVCGAAYFAWRSLHTETLRDPPIVPVALLEPLPLPEPEPLEFEEPEPEEELEIEEVVDLEPVADPLATMDDSLGLDADGSGGSDTFGLKAKRGGRGIIGNDFANADPLTKFKRYSHHITQTLEHLLNREETLRDRSYTATLQVWIDAAGAIRAQLLKSSGDPSIDVEIVETLSAVDALLSPPPSDLPLPVTIRVRSRNAG